ncbi:MAG: hypothetical protein F7C33_03850, partial [Desulfurococcales archaeon]|nr:hypothetical protein [Desulfurococcales archaeon]
KLSVALTAVVLPVYSTTILLSIATRRFSYGLLTGLMVALGFEYLTPPSLQPYRLILDYLFLSKTYTHLAVLGYMLLGVVLAALSVIAYWRGDFVE